MSLPQIREPRLTETATTWIRSDNLHRFLARVSEMIGYNFDEADWDAIRFGVRDTNSEQRDRYEYDLLGKLTVHLAIGCAEDANRLWVHLETSSEILPRIAAFARIMQCYSEKDAGDLEILIAAAFTDNGYPGENHLLACTPEHLAGCEECQDTCQFFQGNH